MKLKQAPYNSFLIAALVLFIAGFFTSLPRLDIHLNDTYFVIKFKFLRWVPSFISFFLWCLYRVTHRLLLLKAITRIHVILTCISLLLLFIIPFVFKYSSSPGGGAPRNYYDFNELNRFKMFGNMSGTITTTLTVFALAQLLNLINLIGGLIKNTIPENKNIGK